MKSISITEFKARCLNILDEVHRTREPVEVTRRGKRLAIVNPLPTEGETDWTPGAFRGRCVIREDIVGFSTESEWDAQRDS